MTAIKKARFQVTGFDAGTMRSFGNALTADVRNRILADQDITDQAARPLWP